MSSKAIPRPRPEDGPGSALLDLAREVDQHLHRIRRQVRGPLHTAFASGALTGPQRLVMQALVHSEGLSLKELSSRVGLAHSTVSGIVDRLAARGLVQRSVNPRDRRATVLLPSAAVKKFLRDQMPQLAIGPLVEALHTASPAQRAVILRGLRTLRRLLDA